MHWPTFQSLLKENKETVLSCEAVTCNTSPERESLQEGVKAFSHRNVCKFRLLLSSALSYIFSLKIQRIVESCFTFIGLYM